MAREVKLSNTSSLFEEVEYPIARAGAAEEFAEVTLLLADGDANLGELIAETTSESFESADDLETDLQNVLPRRAVGEPYQSEGDA